MVFIKKLLYIGWLATDNVGDKLMWDVFENLCKKYDLYEKYKIVSSIQHPIVSDLEGFDLVVLGGGSLLTDGYIEVVYKALSLGKKVYIWGTGLDGAAKDFITSIYENIPAYLYPDEVEYMLQELAPRCEFFGVRGPLTYRALEQSFVDMENVTISGDSGFLLKGEPLKAHIPITTFKKEDKVVGINWGTSFNNIYGRNESIVQGELAKACNYLLDEGYKLYLYNMWSDDIEYILNLYKDINRKENIIVDTNIYSGSILYSILERCTFTINLKLHGNITSVAANTPFICLGYRFKCFDFVKSIDCDELIISTDSENIYEEIIKKVDYINNNYQEIKDKLKTHVDKYTENMETPFKNSLF